MLSKNVLLGLCLIFTASIHGQTYWTGYKIPFYKERFDHIDSSYSQDRITDNVWITRDDSQGPFNRIVEDNYDGSSPELTLWYEGTFADSLIFDFSDWRDAVNNQVCQVTLPGLELA